MSLSTSRDLAWPPTVQPELQPTKTPLPSWDPTINGSDIVSWDVTEAHAFDYRSFDGWTTQDTPASAFVQKVSTGLYAWQLEHAHEAFFVPDPLAMAVAVRPELITQSEDHHVRSSRCTCPCATCPITLALATFHRRVLCCLPPLRAPTFAGGGSHRGRCPRFVVGRLARPLCRRCQRPPRPRH